MAGFDDMIKSAQWHQNIQKSLGYVVNCLKGLRLKKASQFGIFSFEEQLAF